MREQFESFRSQLDQAFGALGVRNLAMPTLISYKEFAKEKDHIAGFCA